MHHFKFKVAQIVFEVKALYESTEAFCKDYLTKEASNYLIEIRQSDIEFEQIKSDRENEKENLAKVVYPASYLETIALYRKMIPFLLENDIILFHGSSIAYEDKGYLFTAMSGTGKSTHTRLWREVLGDKVMMINDDKPLLKINEDGIIIYGTPWMGKHNLGSNCCYPLEAICLIERGKRNEIQFLSFEEMYGILLQQTQRSASPSEMVYLLRLLERLRTNIKLYRLKCTISKEAVYTSLEGMKGDMR